MNRAFGEKKGPTTGNQDLVKELNKAVILNIIWRHAPISRAEIARISGLTRGTVSSLVDELIHDSFVKEIGTGTSAMGRKPIMLQLNAGAGVIVGVDLGVNYVLIILADLRAQVLARKRLSITPEMGEKRILEKMLDGIADILDSAPVTPRGLLGIGAGVPGLVEMEHGVLKFAPNLRWKNVPLKELLQERFDAPVYVDNEANVGALGEKWFGAGQGIRHMVYLSVGVGLGAGIVVNGELYRGATGYAGELGHFTILPDGPLCGCGNRGCWETLASELATLRRAREVLECGEAGILRELLARDHRRSDAEGAAGGATTGDAAFTTSKADKAGTTDAADAADAAKSPTTAAEISDDAADAAARLSVDVLVEACERGDAAAQHVLRETGRYLGIGIAGLVNAFNPEVVIVGNTIGRCGHWVLDEAAREMEARGLSQLIKGVRVVPAMLGPDACAIGGVSLVLSDFLSLPRITF
ncbi:MAG: ROK family transcriptional regulator [Firmicutes bacterium]|nr:ROK family transcriptional regulator [Bacillota bacterium]